MSDPRGTFQQRQAVFAFLRGVGLQVVCVRATRGFLPDVRIHRGGLRVGREATLDAILHEAGHLATVPLPFRAGLHGNVAGGHQAMLNALMEAQLDDQDPLYWAAMHCGDPEATAWAWAVGQHLGLPEELVVLDSSFNGEGADIRVMLRHRGYAGIHGLTHAGMCHHGFVARQQGKPVYPVLTRWLQNGPFPALDGVRQGENAVEEAA